MCYTDKIYVFKHAQPISKSVKIADLTPHSKGSLSLVFEVVRVISRSKDGREVSCQVVDETGMIQAHFDQYSKYFIEGGVYEVTGLRCKVARHHLLLTMAQDTEVCKKPLKMGFKDMENDLSAKFYVENMQSNVSASQKPMKNRQRFGYEQASKIEQKASRECQPQPQKWIQENNRQFKQESQTDKESKKVKWTEKKVSSTSKDLPQKEEKSTEAKSAKTKYRPKEPVQSVEMNPSPISNQILQDYNPIRVLLKDLPFYQQRLVNLQVQVQLKSVVHHMTYFLCRVADCSGSTVVEFNPMTNLQDRAWYRLEGFVVWGDREYGYIAAQQRYCRGKYSTSSIEMVETAGEIANFRLLKYES